MTVLDEAPPLIAAERRNAPAPRRRKRSILTWARGGGVANLLFALPMVLVFAVFSWSPIVQSFVMSFQKTNLITWQLGRHRQLRSRAERPVAGPGSAQHPLVRGSGPASSASRSRSCWPW